MNSSDGTPNIVTLRYNTGHRDSLSIKPVIEAQLRECPQAILWCNGGLFGLIPMERVVNAVFLRNEKRGVDPSYGSTPLVFHWHEAKVLNASELASLGLSSNTGQVRRLRSETQ